MHLIYLGQQANIFGYANTGLRVEECSSFQLSNTGLLVEISVFGSRFGKLGTLHHLFILAILQHILCWAVSLSHQIPPHDISIYIRISYHSSFIPLHHSPAESLCLSHAPCTCLHLGNHGNQCEHYLHHVPSRSFQNPGNQASIPCHWAA